MLYLDIFSKEHVDKVPVSGIVIPRDINYIRRLYQFNFDNIQTYFSTRNFTVKNTHILSRLLEHFPSYLNYDNYRYLEYSLDKVKYLTKHFKITSDLEKGVVHPSYFFGNNGDDILLSTYSHFDVKSTVTNWKYDSPITVLRHNRNDTNYLLPLGTDDGSRSGLNSVLINIPRLSLKYREFVREMSMIELTGEGNLLNKNHFVIKYVLPTMMDSIMDHTLLNLVMDRYYGRDIVTPKRMHKFKLFNPNTQVSRYVDNVLDVITSKRLDFVNMLRNIPLVFTRDASELLSMEDMGVSRQVRWAVISSRIDHMLFLYDSSYSKDINKHYIQDWKRLGQRLINDNSFTGVFSYEQERDIKDKIKKLTEL